MKKKNTLLIIILLSITIINTSCFRDGLIGIRGSGPIISENFYMDDITGIDLQISGDVILNKGDHQEIAIEAQRNIINNIERRVRNGKWEIEFDRNVRSHDGVTIYITVPEIDDLNISGSGSIKAEDYFITNSLDLSISGSGDIFFDVDARYIYSHISGSGEINIYGSTEFHNIHISGSGEVDGFDLISENCEVNIPGSGGARVNVTDNLDVNISGSGTVYFIGNPIISSDISGSGTIINAN